MPDLEVTPTSITKDGYGGAQYSLCATDYENKELVEGGCKCM